MASLASVADDYRSLNQVHLNPIKVAEQKKSFL